MPVITTYNPLGEGLDAAASAIQGGNDARDKALALARAREQTDYDRSEDQKRDQATADDFTERKSEFGSTHALDVQRTEADISHTQHQDKISDAVEATRAKMAPLLERAQQLQLRMSLGQIRGQDLQNVQQSIVNDTAKAKAQLDAEFGKPMAEMALAQAQANYGSTNAATASTQQATAFGALEESGRITEQNLQNQSVGLANQYAGIQNRYAPETFALSNAQARATLAGTANATTDKAADTDYRARLSSFNRANADFQNKIAKKTITKTTDPNGNAVYEDRSGSVVPKPTEPLSPSDYTATVSDTLEAIGDPTKRTKESDKTLSPEEYANAQVQAINRTDTMSAAQKREAILAIKSIMRQRKSGGLAAVPGGSGGSLDLAPHGGSNAAGPFLGSLGL